MKVKDLISLLNDYDGEMQVVVKGDISQYGYVDNILNIAERNIRAAFGNDFTAVVITADDQIGSV